MGDLVEELLAEVEPTPVGLVASSFGSFAVLSHAIARPDGLPPVVHMGCPAMVPGSKPPLRFLLQTIPGLRNLLQLLDPPTLKNAKKAFRQIGHAKAIDSGRIPEVHFEWYAALLRETPTRENELGLFGRGRPRDMFTPADLGQVTGPMSFFWGSDDIFGQSDTARGVSEMIRGSELELLPDSGHLPWLDDPTGAGRHVTEFMARFPP
jgi:pimeloyl-ACP methyl ester carboxylesterase